MHFTLPKTRRLKAGQQFGAVDVVPAVSRILETCIIHIHMHTKTHSIVFDMKIGCRNTISVGKWVAETVFRLENRLQN